MKHLDRGMDENKQWRKENLKLKSSMEKKNTTLDQKELPNSSMKHLDRGMDQNKQWRKENLKL